MKKLLASLGVIIFAGLFCTSMLSIFTGTAVGNPYVPGQSGEHVYFLPY